MQRHTFRLLRGTAAAAAFMLTATATGGGAEALAGADACLAGKLERAGLAAKAWDDDTGRDLRNFPPDRVVDYLHMKLELRFEDLAEPRFEAVETLRFSPIGLPAEAITLDAVGLDVESVSRGGRLVEHYHDGRELTLRFDPPLPPAETQEVVIRYACVEPYEGMTFTPPSSQGPKRGPEVHTQGQTEYNRHWFPCHDFPNERLTTELVVDVPSGFSVSANGRLVEQRDDGSRAVWHYLQDKPHVSYLVSLVIGEFDIVEIPHDRVPMRVWTQPGDGHLVMQTFGRTGEMIDLFEDRFGIAYPWDRYDQLLVRNFGSGGMENTSASTLYGTAAMDEIALADGGRRRAEGLIAHELAHQWTGDMITCRSWAHIWLNEGWATYGAALWFEHRDGEDGYLDYIRRSFRRVAWRDRTSNELPMVSPVYENAWETFRRRANPYPKGCSILHMLRRMLGDDVFFEGVARYMNRHALGTVETADFRYAMEEVSGLGLERFFKQWCYRPGVPDLEVDVHYDAAERALLLGVEQTQEIDRRTPAFRFTLPVAVRTAGGWRTLEVEVAEKTTAFRAPLPGPPTIVAIDPHLAVLKRIDVKKPLAMWLAQAAGGPTIAARHAALAALRDHDVPEVIRALAAAIADESLRYTLRETAVDALADLGSTEARDELLVLAEAGVADPRVRAELIAALEKLDADDVVPLLADVAGSDPSYATRVAAIEALAHHEAEAHADLIAGLVHFPSQHDDVRRAALSALASLDDPRGLDLGIKYAAFGYNSRSRPAAIRAVGELAHHDPDRAVPYLISLLDDPAERAVRAAGRALAETGDERAAEPLRAMSRSHPDPSMRQRAERWLETLQGKDA